MSKGKGKGKEYSLSQASAFISVHGDTLKRWEERSLLPFVVARTAGNHRRYTHAQLLQLKKMLRAGSLPVMSEQEILPLEEALKELCQDYEEARAYARNYVDTWLQKRPSIAESNGDEGSALFYLEYAKGIFGILCYSAAVMEEGPRRVHKWVNELSGASIAEIDEILRWKENSDEHRFLLSFSSQPESLQGYTRAALEAVLADAVLMSEMERTFTVSSH